MIFSLDAGTSFVIALIGTLIFALTLAGILGESTEKIQSFELEEKALMISDSLVKNYDSNNALLGACNVDYDKKRVLTNQLSLETLKKAKPRTLGDIFVESIAVKTKTKKETIKLDSAKSSSACITTKRFALIDGERGIVEVKVCRMKS